MSTAWTGGGCRKIHKTSGLTTRVNVLTLEEEVARDARAEERYQEFLESQRLFEIRQRELAAERVIKDAATAKWLAESRKIWDNPPGAGVVVSPIGTLEAAIHVEILKDDMPVAAYVCLRTTKPDEPDMPIWFLGDRRKDGLKGFLTRDSRQQVLSTHEWLEKEGGIVMLRGSIRVVGAAKSGKSLHVELVEGFRLR